MAIKKEEIQENGKKIDRSKKGKTNSKPERWQKRQEIALSLDVVLSFGEEGLKRNRKTERRDGSKN